MSLPAQKSSVPVLVALPAKPTSPLEPESEDKQLNPAESPARILHERLVESFGTPETRDFGRFSARSRLAILAGLVVLLWSIIGGIVLLLH